ncbi:LTA synthase family protein [Paenibacillus thermoaerophilus]|uniref:LTA synthase family protein n=1 Tax=Paenibacillus thermoaerophilus TaxID=1215385 RepID=A0ABW2V0Q8_9BACL|nr:LTA synthase family protein [Paenibacillus thermoaerophilus]TMV16029.1 LTA synthase family protein [Paenibacillus thermoaerophilus]
MSRMLTRRIGSRSILLFSLLMIFKSYCAWYVIFEDGPSWVTWLKEIPIILMAFCLIEWLASKRKLLYYWIVNLLLTGVFFAVMLYYKYYGVIATYHALDRVNQVKAVSDSVYTLLNPTYLIVFADIAIIGVLMVWRKKAVNWKKAIARKENRKVLLALFSLSLAVCFMNIFPNRASMSEMVKAEKMGILGYEAYTIFADNEEPELIPKEQITQQAIDELKGIKPVAAPAYHGAAAGKNLIVLQLESFQNFLVDLKIDGVEITPNLNRLAHSQFYFPKFYQQVGQGTTSDAEFVVNTSLYIPPRGPAVQEYVDRKLPSLPRLLKEHGYDTATFHTNTAEFWNRRQLYPALGFDRYYDQEFFGTEDTVFFGASDEVLYDKVADELARMDAQDRPFYSHILSMTAHHPFTIPERKYKMKLPERYEDTFVGNYIRAQNYADYALGLFIDELKRNGVWDNSLIVIYGDHFGLPIYSLDRKDQELMSEIYGREYEYKDMINIPLIIASGDGGFTFPATFRQLGGQVDLLPTIANLLGISLDDQIHFGQDLFNYTAYNLLPQRYYLPTGSVISNGELFVTGSGYEDGRRFTLAGGGAPTFEVTEEHVNRALKLLSLSDSYVRQLPALEP